MSLFTTFLTLLIAFPIAWYIARLARGRSKGILFLACLIPFWASELVRTYGWMILLRESGLFSSWLQALGWADGPDRKSTRLNSSHVRISYAVFCLKKKKKMPLLLTEFKNF